MEELALAGELAYESITRLSFRPYFPWLHIECSDSVRRCSRSAALETLRGCVLHSDFARFWTQPPCFLAAFNCISMHHLSFMPLCLLRKPFV